jgi:hypothetical protein
MRLDKRYWIFIACIIAIHIPAKVLTAGAIAIKGKWFEYNPVQAWMMDNMGIVTATVFSILLLVTILVVVPYWYRENEKFGLKSGLFYSLTFIFCGFDSLHDTLVILGSPLSVYTFTIFNMIFSAVRYLLVH